MRPLLLLLALAACDMPRTVCGRGDATGVDGDGDGRPVEVLDAGASAVGVPVTLKIYAGTDEQTRTVATDARGRAVFSDLTAGAAINAVIEADAAHPKLLSSSTVLGAVALGTIMLRRSNSPAN